MKEFNYPSDWSNEDIRLFQAIESAEKLSCLTPCGQDRK